MSSTPNMKSLSRIQRLKRYAALYRSFFSHNLKNEMMYRMTFAINVFMDVFFMGVNVLFFTLVYGNVETVGGWTFHQTLILVGSVGIIRELSYLSFRKGFLELGNYVRTGNFDVMLTSPMNTALHLAFRHVSLTESFGEGVMGLILVAYGFLNLDQYSFASIPFYLLMLGNSLVIYYGFCLLVNSLVFWLIKSQELNSVVYHFMNTARYPREVYHGWGKGFFTFIIPSSLIATTPASILVGRVDPSLIALALGIAVVFLSLGLLFWNRSLKVYGSASS